MGKGGALGCWEGKSRGSGWAARRGRTLRAPCTHGCCPPSPPKAPPNTPQLGSRPPPAQGGAVMGRLPPPQHTPAPSQGGGCSAPWGCPPWSGPPATKLGPAAVEPALFLFREELCWKRNKSGGEAINSRLLHTSSPPPPRARSSLRGRSFGMAPGGSPQPPAHARLRGATRPASCKQPLDKKKKKKRNPEGIKRRGRCAAEAESARSWLCPSCPAQHRSPPGLCTHGHPAGLQPGSSRPSPPAPWMLQLGAGESGAGSGRPTFKALILFA